MPHQCTDCGRSFDDGSKQMLSGCPDCGGNKFQYQPDAGSSSEAGQSEPPSEEPPEPPEPPVDSTVARTVGNAATAVRDFVGSSSASEPEGAAASEPSATPDRSPTPSESQPTADATAATDTDTPDGGDATVADAAQTTEDAAQASARTEVVSKDDLPPAPETPATSRSRPSPVLNDDSEQPDSETTDQDDTPQEDRPDLSQLREELNDQFESIKVLDPGKYELNLMELYDREEYIIALQEDGKYTIQVPERWEEA